ncbi:hypothetical protein E1B28_002788 [Marasmius oreades]|uniref:Uncharacterized protein n=1 Tax=Marasmius oreades TaxID=181124 RepID=A0A9P7UL87_9AGAR|nr:uncharacterized protein E1B28_002788 [Marasmius oreades]KAG7086867.1 hypothetical protein E1B28_002788 [Marasmius oreades]
MHFSFFVVAVVALSQALASPTELVDRTQPEIVSCYNSGTKSDRAPFVAAIDQWCAKVIGTHLNNGQEVSTVFEFGAVDYWLSAKAINGCSFTIDGNCNRLLRLPVDRCNTGGENGKQGGVMTDPCGQWRADPGRDGNSS